MFAGWPYKKIWGSRMRLSHRRSGHYHFKSVSVPLWFHPEASRSRLLSWRLLRPRLHSAWHRARSKTLSRLVTRTQTHRTILLQTADTSGRRGRLSMARSTFTVSLFPPSPWDVLLTQMDHTGRVRKVWCYLLQLSHLPSLSSHHGVADPRVLERDVRWLPRSQRSGDHVHDLDRNQRPRR